MKSRLVRIGNSRGVRLAKPLLEQAGLVDEVDIRVESGSIIISAASTLREGWAEAAAKYEPKGLLDAPSATRFDDEEWEW